MVYNFSKTFLTHLEAEITKIAKYFDKRYNEVQIAKQSFLSQTFSHVGGNPGVAILQQVREFVKLS